MSWCLGYFFSQLKSYPTQRARKTQQDHSVEMSCITMGESSSKHVTILKSLIITDILIVRRKKYFIKNKNLINMYYHWKIELIGKALGKKNCRNLKNVWEILRRSALKLKNIFFPLWLYFYNFFPSITLWLYLL